MTQEILYYQVDISGWNKKAKDFIKKYLECTDIYVMGMYEGMKEEELDHYVILRGGGKRIDRVLLLIEDKYKCYGMVYRQKADDRAFPSTENTITYEQFLDKWRDNKEYRDLLNNINAIARESMVK